MFIRIALPGVPGSEAQTLAHRLSESMKLPLLPVNQPDDTDKQLLDVIRQQLDTSSSFILTGFPATLPQAQALDQMLAWLGSPVDLVIMLSNEQGRPVCDDKLETAPQESDISGEDQLAAAEKQFARLARYYKTQNKLLFIHTTGDADIDLKKLQAALKARMSHGRL